MAIGSTTNMQWLGGHGGAAVRYTGENGVIVNNTTNKISADFDVVQHKLTQGSNITITNNVISAQQPDVSQFVTSTEVSTAINNAIGNVRQVPASSSTEANKVLTVDAQGGYGWQPVPSSPSGVTDVKVDGTSVVTAGVANITMPTVPTVDQTYDSTSSNPQSGVAVAQALAGYTPGGGGVTPISTPVITSDPTTLLVYGTVFTHGDFKVTLQGSSSHSAFLYVENPNVSSAYVVSRVNGGCYIIGSGTFPPDSPDVYYDVPSLVTPVKLANLNGVNVGYPVFYDVIIMYTENNVPKTFGFTALHWTPDYVSHYTKVNITAG